MSVVRVGGLLALLTLVQVGAQDGALPNWVRSYGTSTYGEITLDVQPTSDGGCVAAGNRRLGMP